MSSSRLRNNANQKRVSALEALAEAKKSGRRLIEQIQLNEELVYESVSEDEYELTSRKRGSKQASVVIDELYGYDDDDDDQENNANRKKSSRSKRSKTVPADTEPKPLSSTFIKRKQVLKETPRSARSDDALKQEIFESLMISADANLSPNEEDDLSEIDKQLVLFGQKQDVTNLKKEATQPARIDADCFFPNFMMDFKVEDQQQGSNEEHEEVIAPQLDPPPEREITQGNELPPHVDDVSANRRLKPNSIKTETNQDFSWLKEKQHEDNSKKATPSSLVAADNSLYFFWLDACEDPQNSGSIVLFGKAKSSLNDDVTTSCCVVVENNLRNLFVMPRSYMLADPDDPSTEMDQEVTMDDVYTEFREFASDHKVHKWLSSKVTRKYAFDNPEGKIALEADVLKVAYAADLPALPRDAHGRSFSHVFGTQTSFLENFLLKRKLMGPQWLRIENVAKSNSNRSWVNAEFITSSPKNVKTIENRSSPSISVLSLSILCLFNNQTQQNEVVAVSGLLHSEVSIDAATKNPDSLEHFAAIRPIMGQTWPEDLQSTIRRHGISLNICSNERALLSFLVTKLYLIDPDVIVGHNLYNTTLDILLSRMSEYKLSQWSKLGRLRRPGLPRISRGGEHSHFSVSVVAGGRLFCDTAVSSKELIRETSYDLTHLSQSLLNIKRDSIDISKMMSTSNDIINLVRYCSNDAYIFLAIMFRLQILPLTKQLTVLGGHTWAKSLQSARAQRVEFLLLHEFHRLKYIKPEKYSYTERKKQLQAVHDSASSSKKRKPAYSGGLVLDPIKGFYDNYVLLLDFNSLYPSIIQEFNICFTTVKHWQTSNDDTNLPEIPADSEPFGVLPRVIKALVSRRQEVKRLLKSESNPIARQEYDIRQQALKLVANSMYGCLGFPGSRFYCKPLAALITFQGRSILKKTVDTIESLNFKVIYGDTDSVLIATNSRDLELVEKIGNEVKREVNKVYRTLEIEIDGIFKSFLLLQKKKYAAIVVTVNNGKITEKREIKGLEMVRRDWCPLSKNIGEKIIDIILSTSSRDDVVDSIHALLSDISQKVRNNQIPVNEFIITKGLSKHPSEYPEASTLPHVAVALQMIENGDIVRVGDHIPYVICKTDEKSSLFQKARHPSLLQTCSDMSLDYEWYLSQQILPPVLRLCAHIVGTDTIRLADCLGLDSSRYTHSHSNSADIPQEQSFQTALHLRHLDDDEAFKTVPKLYLQCPSCKFQFEFKGALDSSKMNTGLKCPSSECTKSFDDACSINYMALQVYKYWMKEAGSFNEGWKICEDGSCNQRSRCGSACTTCHAPMHPVYKASDLYLVLRYLIALFDIDRAIHRVARENTKRSRQSLPPIEFLVPVTQRSAFDSLRSYVESVMLQHSAFSVLNANDVFYMFRRDSQATVIV